MKIGVVGLGKLGLPMACLLSRVHEVWGYDTNEDLVKSLANGSLTTWEPDCDYGRIKLAFPGWHDQALVNCDLVLVAVNTPTNPKTMEMDLSQVQAAVGKLAQDNLTHGVARLPVVINSTVMPGTCRALQDQYRDSLVVMANPVWIALGSVVRDLQNPPALVIGCECDGSVMQSQDCPHFKLGDMWLSVLADWPNISYHLTDTRTAEFLKLAHNTWCCIKMSWLGNLGDHAKELDINIQALSRFMSSGGERHGAFWKYGPSFGGPCFPRDLEFWLRTTTQGRTHSGFWTDSIAGQALSINKGRVSEAASRIPQGSRVVILGKSYKPGVPVEDGSLGRRLAQILCWRCDVTFEDEGWLDSETDWYIVCHRELESRIPKDTKARILNLWEVP